MNNICEVSPFGKTLKWLNVFIGPRPGPAGTFGLATKSAVLFTLMRRNLQIYTSVAISCGLLEAESSSIFLPSCSLVIVVDP